MYLNWGQYITVTHKETLTHPSYELKLIFFLMRLSPVFNFLPELGRLIHSGYFIVLCDVDPCIYTNSKSHLKTNHTPRNVDTEQNVTLTVQTIYTSFSMSTKEQKKSFSIGLNETYDISSWIYPYCKALRWILCYLCYPTC